MLLRVAPAIVVLLLACAAPPALAQFAHSRNRALIVLDGS